MDAFCFNRDHVVLILKFTLHQQELFVHQAESISLKQVRRDDGVGDARFVFQAQEDKTSAVHRYRALSVNPMRQQGRAAVGGGACSPIC